MSEEKKEKWLSYLALTTVIFAVFATLSTFNGGKFSTRAVISQSKASNKWSHYQSKSLKGYLYEVQKDKLGIDLIEKEDAISPKAEETVNSKIKYYADQISRYEQEKKDIMAEALSFEKLRDDSQIHSRHFGYSIIALQIAILMSGIAGFIRDKRVWLASILIGVVGIFIFFESFGAFLEPFLQKYHLFV